MTTPSAPSTPPTPGIANVGVVGLAVMGSNLARNFASKGFKTAIFNRSYAKTASVLEEHPEAEFVASETVEDFVDSLEKPRRIIMMVKAGPATDATIQTLLPHLDQGDIIIDGGNTYFPDTRRREKELADQGFHFIGCGISGGETGALLGPSMMPGGPVFGVLFFGSLVLAGFTSMVSITQVVVAALQEKFPIGRAGACALVVGVADLAGVGTVRRIVLEQQRVRRDVDEVVDGDHLDLGRALDQRLERLAADAAEAVDADANGHRGPPRSWGAIGEGRRGPVTGLG